MDNEQYLELFLSEADEILTTLNLSLIELEKNPTDNHLLAEIFRSCHTLKGNAAAMGITRVEKLAHAMESILELLRSGKMPLTQQIVSCLFQGVDLLGALIGSIQNRTQKRIDETSLLEELAELTNKPLETKKNTITIEDEKPKILEHPSDGLVKIKSVRINLERLESIMNTVGQLHIGKIRLSELSRQRQDGELTTAVNEIERTVNQLQDEMMQMRLLPLKYILNNFPRLVRDDASKEGKEVKLTITGEDIGLDRTILDEINDPLIHILRNAVTHGIELPDARKKMGKTPQGHIHISAQQEQNMVLVSIQDDGCGLDSQKIREGLYKQGLVPADSLEKLSEEDIFLLITLQGFSLSEQISERAGRGVGMNVVKDKIESIGGSVAIKSELGKGTTFTLRLPISMAIIHALLVSVDNEVCAIPLYHIIETIKMETSQIKTINRQEMVPYRDEVLPLIRLQEKPNGVNKKNEFLMREKICIVVCEINHQKIGFLVEKFIGQQEIVIKNLSGYMHNIRGYSGATILGNGRVAMILDLASLLRSYDEKYQPHAV